MTIKKIKIKSNRKKSIKKIIIKKIKTKVDIKIKF